MQVFRVGVCFSASLSISVNLEGVIRSKFIPCLTGEHASSPKDDAIHAHNLLHK